MSTIGFIGLGNMGGGMAANLQRKGFDLVVYDTRADALVRLTAMGARAANGVPGVAQSGDIIVTMLPDPAAVQAVVLGPDGLLANGRPGQVILDMSTVDPGTTELIAAKAGEKGMSVVDAPVGRLALHAERGESLFMVGAADADFKRVLPLLQVMGTTIHHCGGVGAGTRTKLVNNYLVVTLCQVNAEALALSQKFGLDLAKTLEVLHGTTATNGQLKMNWANKVLTGDVAPGFAIELAHKDMGLVLAAAHAAKVPMPVAAAVHEMFSLARSGPYAARDFSAMGDFLCELASIEKPRLPKA